MQLSSNYTYNNTEDTAGEQRVRRPKHLANIGIDYQVERLTLSANLRLVQDFTDLIYDATTYQYVRIEMDDYQVVDLSARYAVNKHLSVFARIENLFDEEYQDLSAYYTKGQSPYLGIKFQF